MILRFAMVLAMTCVVMRSVEAADLVLRQNDCMAIVKHHPSDDVAFKPGVDVNGKPVVPADLDNSAEPIRLPDKITIPLSVDLADSGQTPGINARPFGTLKTEAGLGSLTFDLSTNDLFFDGKKISDGSKSAISDACAKAYGKPAHKK